VTASKNIDYYIRFRYKITPFPLLTIKARLAYNNCKCWQNTPQATAVPISRVQCCSAP